MGIDARINEYRVGMAGSDGVVTLFFGGVPPWCQWQVDQISIDLSRGTGQCSIVHGPTIQAPISIDSTTLANANQDSPANWRLYPGEQITARFTALQPGVTASVQLRARQEAYP